MRELTKQRAPHSAQQHGEPEPEPELEQSDVSAEAMVSTELPDGIRDVAVCREEQTARQRFGFPT